MAALKLPKLTEVLVKVHRSGILELRLNTPENLNSFGGTKYWELIEGFNYAKANPDIKAVVVSSTGRFFSSGAALTATGMKRGDNESAGAKAQSPAGAYIDCLIDFPKLAVCALQGPAYGITVTTLPLFDLVYGTPEVTLTAPFSRIGIALEGCSSVTFPPIFGPSMTSRILYLADTVPISELGYTGLFADVLPKEGMQEAVVQAVADKLDDLAIGSIIASKSLVRAPEYRDQLRKLNAEELAVVEERVKTQEHRDTITRFQEKRAREKAQKKAQAKL